MAEELNVIFHACERGRTDIVQKALASVRSGLGEPNSPEINEVIANLISTGRAEDGLTPLHVAAQCGHADVIRALLNAGASLSTLGTYGEVEGMRPYDIAKDGAQQAFHIYMFEAVAMSNLELIQDLLDGGVPPGVTDGSSRNDSALHWAVSSSDIEVSKTLLNFGADIEARNAAGKTPMHVACETKRPDVVYLLLSNGASSSAEDNNGLTARDYISSSEGEPGDAEAAILSILEDPPEIRLLYQPPPALGSGIQSGGDLNEEKLGNSNNSIEDGEGVRSRVDSGTSYDYFDEDKRDGLVATPLDPILVLWPPPQRMTRRHSFPFILSNDGIISLTAPSQELDTVNLLLDTLNSFQFHVEVTSPLAGAIFKLSIDPYTCPKRASYELIIDPGQVQLVGADAQGLRYGTQTLIQLMQLHSDLTLLENTEVVVLKLPSICISDWPDIETRAVLWSHRHVAINKPEVMDDVCSLLSKLRVNALMLMLDAGVDPAPVIDDSFNVTCGGSFEAGVPYDYSSGLSDSSDDATRNSLHHITQLCRRHLIQVIPTVVLTSIRHCLPRDTLSSIAQQHRRVVVLNMDYDQKSVANELIAAMREKETSMPPDEPYSTDSPSNSPSRRRTPVNHVVTKTDVENSIKQRCADVMSQLKEAGVLSITLVCNDWVRSICNPIDMVFRFGMNGIERSASTVFPTCGFNRHILSSRDFMYTTQQIVSKSRDVSSGLTVLPAFLDTEVLMPLLLIKHFCFIYSGFAWNFSAVIDMLGDLCDPYADATILREVVYLSLFSHQPDLDPDLGNALLSLFTGQLFLQPQPQASVSSNATMTSEEEGGGESADAKARRMKEDMHCERESMLQAERILFILLTTRENIGNFDAIDPSAAGHVVKYYRRLLHMSKWKMGTGKYTLEVDEFFSLVSLVHGLAKSVVYCYAGKDKVIAKLASSAHNSSQDLAPQQAHEHGTKSKSKALVLQVGTTYSSLLGWVAPGTNSDTANFLLETLEHISSLWHDRYMSIWFFKPHFYANLTQERISYDAEAHKPVVMPDPHLRNLGQDGMLSAFMRRRSYYRAEREGVPTTAIFNAGIMSRLPAPMVVEKTFYRLFGGDA